VGTNNVKENMPHMDGFSSVFNGDGMSPLVATHTADSCDRNICSKFTASQISGFVAAEILFQSVLKKAIFTKK
jgi:hypothetical protein